MRRPLHRVQSGVARNLLAHCFLEGSLVQFTATPRCAHILHPARDEGLQSAGLDGAVRMAGALLVAQDTHGALDQRVRRARGAGWTRSRRMCFLRHLALAHYTDTARSV